MMVSELKYLIFFLGIYGCSNNTPSSSTPSVSEEKNESFYIDYTNVFDIEETDYLAIPVSHEEISNRNSSYFSSGSYKEMPKNSYWNIVFYNIKTQATHLLDKDRKMFLQPLNFNDTTNGKIASKYLFYQLQEDYNKDGKFTDADPNLLFISDKSGLKFRQLTPLNFDVYDYDCPKKTNFMIIKGRFDSNKDGVFNEKDEHLILRSDFENNGLAYPVFKESFDIFLKGKIEKDWKLPKEN